MKKNLFWAAFACVALASCVNESEPLLEGGKGQPLTFGAPVMYNQSRHVGEIAPGAEYPTDESFTVFGIEHNGDFAGWNAGNVIKREDQSDFFPAAGEVVEKGANDNHWYTSKDYYLPTEPNYKLSFSAYSPSRAKGEDLISIDGEETVAGQITYGVDGLKITNWRMPDANMYDLMYSTRTINVKQDEVHIAFLHALSSVHVRFAKPAVDGPYSVQVTKVAVKGSGTSFNNVGTFEDRITSAADGSAAVWDKLKQHNIPAEYTIFSGDTYEVPTSTAGEPETANKRSFLPIPQQITSDMKLVLSYKIKMKESDSWELIENLEIPFLDFKITETENTKGWLRAHRYIYNITFGALTKIKFHPSVTNWTEVSNAGTYVIK
jgi:hypothetical protein